MPLALAASAGSPRKRPKAVSRLGFAGATSLEDGRTAHQLDVDEYGIPRTASTDATGGFEIEPGGGMACLPRGGIDPLAVMCNY